jgi:hypothetical protein
VLTRKRHAQRQRVSAGGRFSLVLEVEVLT